MKQQNPIGGAYYQQRSHFSPCTSPPFCTLYGEQTCCNRFNQIISLDGRVFNIACGQKDIGNASSEMTKKIEEGVLQADGSQKIEPTIKVEDVGGAVAYMASLPPDTNIPFLTIMANQMPYMGRG